MAHGSAAAWGYLHLGLESSDRLGVSIARYGDDMFFGININARRIRIDAHLRPSGVLGSTSGARCLGLSPSRKEQ
jgi:hypothetical protein